MHKRLFSIFIACIMLLTAASPALQASAADVNKNPSAAAVDVQRSKETKTYGDFVYTEDEEGGVTISKYKVSDS